MSYISPGRRGISVSRSREIQRAWSGMAERSSPALLESGAAQAIDRLAVVVGSTASVTREMRLSSMGRWAMKR